jgi:hypothetical protein
MRGEIYELYLKVWEMFQDMQRSLFEVKTAVNLLDMQVVALTDQVAQLHR